MKKILICSAFLLSANAAFSSPETPPARINYVGVWGNGTLFVNLDPSITIAETSCNSSRFIVSKTNKNYNQILALVTAAYSAGQQIIVQTGSCNAADGPNGIGYPQIDETTNSKVLLSPQF